MDTSAPRATTPQSTGTNSWILSTIWIRLIIRQQETPVQSTLNVKRSTSSHIHRLLLRHHYCPLLPCLSVNLMVTGRLRIICRRLNDAIYPFLHHTGAKNGSSPCAGNNERMAAVVPIAAPLSSLIPAPFHLPPASFHLPPASFHLPPASFC